MAALLNLIKQPHEICFSRNPIVFRFKITPYDDDAAALNTIISCTLYAESSHYKNDFTELKQVALRPDTDGFAEIDWSKLLDAQIEFYVPKLGETGIQSCPGQAVRYYVRYSLVNDYEQAQTPIDTDKAHCVKGGLAYEQWAPREFFDQKILVDHEYLRYGEPSETATPDEPLYVYFFDPVGFDTSAATLLAYISLKLQPGATTPSINVSSRLGDGGGVWQIYCVAIGYTQQNLASLVTTGKIAESLYVEVFNGASRIGRILGIRLDYRNRYEMRTLHYHNSLGGYDTQVMRGQVAISATYDKQSITRLDTGAYATGRLLKAITRYDAARETAQLKGETGWITEARAERLRDLLNSNNAWELTGSRLKPVRITTKTATLYANTDKLFSLSLDWEDAFSDANYTPDGYLSENAACPEVEFLQADQQVQAMLRLNWQLPEGYDNVEIRIDTTNTLPGVIAGQQFFFGVNAGVVDVPFAAATGSTTPMPVYVWARVICNAATASYGPWTPSVTTSLTKYVAPKITNVFVKTYKGSGARDLDMAALDTYVTLRNGGSTTKLLSVPSTGSQGGSVTLSGTNIVGYTPPTPSFTGVDVITFQAAQTFPLPPYSPYATGKIYVTVGNASDSVSSPTGLPYVKLNIRSGGTITANGNRTSEIAYLSLSFFKDPLGTIPYDVTGLGLNVILSITSSWKGTTPVAYANQTTAVIGTQFPLSNQDSSIMIFGEFPLYRFPEGDFSYTLAASSNYHVL